MARVVILGTASAIPDEKHENTHLLVMAGERNVLIDCVGNPIANLRKAGCEPNSLTDLILTHFHPDHVSSAPLLLMDLWLLGRKDPLDVYGLEATLERLETVMAAYDWKSWPGFYPLRLNPLPAEELTPVLASNSLRVLASPVKHLIPTIGLRFEFNATGKTLAYSSDTEPYAAVVRLANGADVLIHEATSASIGHTSAAQAGEIARQAEVGKLVLIHYDTNNPDLAGLTTQAQQAFTGEVILAQDGMALDLS
jgi:ribonuclease Z